MVKNIVRFGCCSVAGLLLSSDSCLFFSGSEALKLKLKFKMNFYDILQIDREADAAQIKKQYYKLARKVHPDRNLGDVEANAKFQKLGQAYETLSNPQLRQEYDAGGQGATEAPTDYRRVYEELFKGLGLDGDMYDQAHEWVDGCVGVDVADQMDGDLCLPTSPTVDDVQNDTHEQTYSDDVDAFRSECKSPRSVSDFGLQTRAGDQPASAVRLFEEMLKADYSQQPKIVRSAARFDPLTEMLNEDGTVVVN